MLRDPTFFESIGIFEKHYNLYHYIDKQRKEKLEGKTISAKNIKKAREELKSYKAEMDEFMSNFRRTKQDSNNSYMKMLEELENLKKPKNATCKHSRSLSKNRNPSAVSNKLLLESFDDMIELNQGNIQKLQADLAVMTKTQESILTALEKLSQENQEKMQKSLGKLEPKTELEEKTQESIHTALEKLSLNQEKMQKSLGKLEPKPELEDKFRHSSPGAFDE